MIQSATETSQGPLAFPGFRRVCIAQAFSAAGYFMQLVAATWYVYSTTGSASSVGILAAVAMGPALVGSPLGGALLDRFDPRRLAVLLTVAQAVPAAAMAILDIVGELSVGWLYLLTLAGAIPASLNQPVTALVIPYTLPAQYRTSAVALSSMIFNIMRLFGAALGGLIVEWAGVGGAFSINAFSYLVLAVVFARTDLLSDEDAHVQQPVGKPGGREWLTPMIRLGGLAVAVFFVLIAPVEQLMPVVAKEHGLNARYVGFLLGAIGVGAMLANRSLHRWNVGGHRRQQLMAAGLLCAAAGMVFLALTPSQGIVIDLLAAALIGFGWELVFIAGKSTVAIDVPAPFRGRLMGMFFLLVTAATAAGTMGLGLLHEWLGLTWTFLIAAAVSGAAGALVLAHATGEAS